MCQKMRKYETRCVPPTAVKPSITNLFCSQMLYASSRNNLTKALGSAPFTDSIYATSKADVDAKAYASHRASLAAPKPMTAREKEIEEIKAAESRSATYDGSRARKSHVGKIGFTWTPEVEQAVKELGESDEGRVLILVRRFASSFVGMNC